MTVEIQKYQSHSFGMVVLRKILILLKYSLIFETNILGTGMGLFRVYTLMRLQYMQLELQRDMNAAFKSGSTTT